MDIKEYRKGKGLTQQQLANKLGVSVRTIQDWEQGRHKPDRRSKIALDNLGYR